MLTFFRRIRKELLQRSRTSKYLLYAIGEIALVVLGILIALQINNWNEDRKARKQELRLLKELHDNLFFDIDHNKFKLDNNRSSVHSCEIILRQLTEKSTYHDSLNFHFANAHNWNIAVVRDHAYQNAKVYGLDFISEDSLKFQLSWTYESNMNFLSVLSDRQNLYHYNVVVPVLSELFESAPPQLRDGKYEMVPIDYAALTNSHKYKNILRSTIQMHEKYFYHYNNLYQRMLNLSQGLEAEIMARTH